MDANDPTLAEPRPLRDAPPRWSRWTLPVLLPLALLAVTGAANHEAVSRALRPVTVLPAVHVQPAPPLARFDDATSDALVEAADSAGPAYRVVETILMEVTAYCPCTKCCGPLARGLTASGLPVSHNDSRFVAADVRVLPFGTTIRIPGYHGEQGAVVPVIDRGGAIKGKRLDVYFPTHRRALEWGRQILPVQVVEPVGAD